jgi:GPH family glycoside/pentoside/hexuronide:cation symporter
MAEKMSTKRQLAYAAGAPGFASIDHVVGTMLLYFYLPPPGRGLVSQLPQETLFGPLTAFGIAMLIARTVDSVASPLIGHASDLSRSRLGHRRAFMLFGLLPMLALPLLAYWPPSDVGGAINAVWLTGVLSCYYVFATMYSGPHGALIPEIARSDEERARLTRLLALCAFPMAGLLMAWPRGIDWGREVGMAPTESMRAIVIVLALVAFVLCSIPLFAIDERRFTERIEPEPLSLRESLASVLANRPFRIFLGAHVLFASAASLIFPMLPYLATVMLGRSEGFAFDLSASLGLMIALGYAIVPRLLGWLRPKRILLISFAIFGAAAAALGMIEPSGPGQPQDVWNLAIAFTSLGVMGLAIAGVSLLPNVLVGQLIDEDAARGGTNRSALFLGVMRAFDKWAFGLSAATIAYLFVRFGNGPDTPLGVQLVGPIAAALGLSAALVLARFPEERS